MTQATDDTRPPTDPEEARTFTTVVSDLERTYPKDKLEEISTSFCFICLLHLANEQGLKLEVDKEEIDDEVEEVKVGDIFGLKVRKNCMFSTFRNCLTCGFSSRFIEILLLYRQLNQRTVHV